MFSAIRKAKPTDLAEVSRLNRALFKIQHKFDPTANLNWTFSSNGQKYLKKRISGPDGFMEVVEGKPGKLIGCVVGAIVKRPIWRINAKYAELESIIVEPEHRGANFGSKLLADFISWCQKNKVDYISLLVASQNKPAIGFYRKHSFKDYDLVMQFKLTP